MLWETSRLETSHSLLDRLRSDSSSADWDRFVSIYHPFLTTQLSRCQISSVDAEDICQETLAQVFRAIAGFSHNGRPGAFRNWLKKIVRQKIWKLKRPDEHNRTVALGTSVAEDRAVADTFESLWDLEHDRFVVNRLLQLVRTEFTETSWQSFRRVVIDCERPQIVADSLSISLNAVLISKSRILKRLREMGHGLIDQI